MRLNEVFFDESSVKDFDGDGFSQFFSREFLSISQNGRFFTLMSFDVRAFQTKLDMTVMEEIVSSEIDDIIEDNEWIDTPLCEVSIYLAEHRTFRELVKRYELMGIRISLVDNKIDITQEEYYDLMEVDHGYRMANSKFTPKI
ncbi:MAG: hypothetical protein AAF244_03870 [Pseudomonadota bacterium]